MIGPGRSGPGRVVLVAAVALVVLCLGPGLARGAPLPSLVPARTALTLTLPPEIEQARTEDQLTLRLIAGDHIRETQLLPGVVPAVLWPRTGTVDTHVSVLSSVGEMLWAEQAQVRVVPGWLTLLPALTAIVLAVVLREIILSLFFGVLAGSLLIVPNPLAIGDALQRVVRSLADPDRASILIFSLMLGGMVGIIQKNGGARGIVDALATRARSRRGVQLATWGMGLVIFFDDYANSVLLGTTLRPLSDRVRLSRERLAFLVDSTAAPVASIALFSTWIGYELSLIQQATGLADGPTYWLFVESLAYRFYPILVLLFIPMMILTDRSFGPMLAADRRALATGAVLRPGSQPASEFASDALAPPDHVKSRWADAVVPILSVVVTTVVALVLTGRAAATSAGLPLDARTIIGNADAYGALLWSAFVGCAVAAVLTLARRSLSLGGVTEAWLTGVRSMLVAFIILILAAAIGTLCKDLFVPQYAVALLGERMPSWLLPAAVFVVAAVASLATGSSWSTMAILIPLVAPLSLALASRAGLGELGQHQALVAAIGSVLAGSIFGDHCSPLSDTTVLSSMAASCDHLDHVRTQAPIAVVVATVSILCGSIPAALGAPLVVVWTLAILVLFGFLRIFGRRIAPDIPQPPQNTLA